MTKTKLASNRLRHVGLGGAAFALTLTALIAAQADEGKEVQLKAKPNAGKAGLEAVTGEAKVDVAKGDVTITVTLPEGKSLPQGSVLEGWLSTAGDLGGPGRSSSSKKDEKYGETGGKAELAKLASEGPYALSTGVLSHNGDSQTYVGHFHIDNELTPYAAVAVTLESDGNNGNYDPRPGSPLLDGMIK